VTNSLYGNYGRSTSVAVLYGLHLTAIAGLNAWLWWIATRGQPERPELAGALSPLLLLLLGTAAAAVSPKYAQYLWLLAFGGVLAHRFVGGRFVA
jgi:hypothetical protein